MDFNFGKEKDVDEETLEKNGFDPLAQPDEKMSQRELETITDFS